MPIYGDDQSIYVYDRNDFLMRRNTNTMSFVLEADEVFTLIHDLSGQMARGGPVYLVVESDKVFVKDMD